MPRPGGGSRVPLGRGTQPWSCATLYLYSKSESCAFISPILLTLRSPTLKTLTAALPPGSCGWRGSSWMMYVLAQVSPGVLGWVWAESRTEPNVCTGSWVVNPGRGGWAWEQSGYRGLPLSIPLACCQLGPFCVHGPCSAPTVPVPFPQPSKQKRKFSSFFKSLVIELDKDLYGPDNHLVEVRQIASALPADPRP